MEKRVKIIPPKAEQPAIQRVAAYCRVSSDSADQLHSYAAQIRAYTDLIQGHDGWELVDIYADEGLTGTRMDQREDLNRLLADCRRGRVDKVLVKSISRLARNTRDCLTILRELFRLGVTVQFEKENIDTGTLTSELMVSVSASLAQQESISISQNQRLSYQRRMERGEFITCKAPFGYRMPDGKNLEIYEEEARLVRQIFDSYLQGKSTLDIAADMDRLAVHTRDKKVKWTANSINYILTNEKYIGDALCQKKFTTASLPFVEKRNRGERDQYYVEDTHPAIIARDVFERTQALIQARAWRKDEQQRNYLLTKKVACGHCGSTFIRRETKKGYVSWSCRRHIMRSSDCPMGRIGETELYAAFLRMYHKLKQNEDIVLTPTLKQLEDLENALHRDDPAMLDLNKAIAQAMERSYNISKLQTAGLLDAEACAAKYNEINAKLASLRTKRHRMLRNEELEDTLDALRQMVDTVHNGPDHLEGFDEELFHALVERITAQSQTQVCFRLRGGLEVTEYLREGKR